MKLTCNFENVVGKMKAMHGVGQPPWVGISDQYLHYLKEANIPYSRLHDMGGYFGGNLYVDIPNVFRDFNADEQNPDSYDFAFTDILIEAMMKFECEPIYRLGVTIENFRHIKAYRINPPENYQKWAGICEHIIRHYTEGWADGFYYPIRYWEIWNEPEEGMPQTNLMWTGSALEYYELYSVTAKHLKRCFGDKIKVGGYAACCAVYTDIYDPEKYRVMVEKPRDEWGELAFSEANIYRLDFLYGFFDYIKKQDAPLDFFSWHSYASVECVQAMADFVDKVLTEHGYGDAETMLNEWNNASGKPRLGSSEACAKAAAMMCGMQNKKTNILCYYDARMRGGRYGGLFNTNTNEPYCIYYSFVCFGELYQLGNQVSCEYSQDGLYAVAATDGEKKAVMIANISGKEIEIATNLEDDMKVYVVDAEHYYTETSLSADRFMIKNYEVIFVKNYE